MCHALCHCVPGLQLEQAQLYWCHRLLIGTRVLAMALGKCHSQRGTGHFWTGREGWDQGRVLTNPPQGALVQGQAWTG